MQNHRAEGIILHALDFRETDQILTVFTKERGIIKLFYRGGNSQRKRKGAVTSPLTQAEFVYRTGNSELYKCQEISICNLHHMLRGNLDQLECACQMLHAIKISQFPNQPAPMLYELLIKYISFLTEVHSPEV